MFLPELKVLSASREMITQFGGYNHNLRIGDGEFYDVLNTTADYYPVLSPRRKRGTILPSMGSNVPGDMVYKKNLWYVWGNQVIGYKADNGANKTYPYASSGCKLIHFGIYILVLSRDSDNTLYPEYWINTGTLDSGKILFDDITGGSFLSIYLCDENGEDMASNCHVGQTEPSEVLDSTLWFDTSAYESSFDEEDGGTPGVLKRYYAYNKGWFEEQSYLKIVTDKDLSDIQTGDFINLDLPYVSCTKDGKTKKTKIYGTDNAFEVIKKGTLSSGKDYVVVKGQLTNDVFYTVDGNSVTVETPETGWTYGKAGNTLKISATPWPLIDHIFECNNRLWACRYGLNKNGEFVNEIYASKLGSYKVWDQFNGISSDSYVVSCGTDGEFTGAVNYNGTPLFFKENFMHKAYGNYPFQVTPISCSGVKKGSENSLAVVNNVLYFHSREGISYYDGSIPQDMSFPFGWITYDSVIAAGTNYKYFFKTNTNDLFVYDTKTKILHKEALEAVSMCSDGEEVFAWVRADNQQGIGYALVSLLGSVGAKEDNFDWYCETGMIGLLLADKKYVSGIQIRMKLDIGSTVKVFVQYDSGGDFEHQFTMTGRNLESFVIPIRPKRCDHMRIRIEGKGNAKIYSITKTIEQGSEV